MTRTGWCKTFMKTKILTTLTTTSSMTISMKEEWMYLILTSTLKILWIIRRCYSRKKHYQDPRQSDRRRTSITTSTPHNRLQSATRHYHGDWSTEFFSLSHYVSILSPLSTSLSVKVLHGYCWQCSNNCEKK